MKNSNQKKHFRMSILMLSIVSLLFINCKTQWESVKNSLMVVKVTYESIFTILEQSIPQEDKQKFCEMHLAVQNIWDSLVIPCCRVYCENAGIASNQNTEQIKVNITSFGDALKAILVYAKANQSVIVYTDAALSICAITITILTNHQVEFESNKRCDLDMYKISKECKVISNKESLAIEKAKIQNRKLLNLLNGLDKRYRTIEVEKLKNEIALQK